MLIGFGVWKNVENVLQVFAEIILDDVPIYCSLSELIRNVGRELFVAHAEKLVRNLSFPTLSFLVILIFRLEVVN